MAKKVKAKKEMSVGETFGSMLFGAMAMAMLSKMAEKGMLEAKGDRIVLSKKGKKTLSRKAPNEKKNKYKMGRRSRP